MFAFWAGIERLNQGILGRHSEGGVLGIQWVEMRDDAKHPTEQPPQLRTFISQVEKGSVVWFQIFGASIVGFRCLLCSPVGWGRQLLPPWLSLTQAADKQVSRL